MTRHLELVPRRTILFAAIAALSVLAGLLQARTGDAAGAQPSKATAKGSVLFGSNRAPAADYEIFAQDQSAGSLAVNLTNSPATQSDYDPAWSPDGKRITFTRSDGDEDIVIMNRDGSGQVPLTSNTDVDRNAVFSPDGTKIAFASDRDTGFLDVYVMDANGANPVRLTFATSGATENFGPDWSPDGTKITFISERDGGNNDREVFVMNADGTAQVQLTANAAQDQAPKYSPDGKKIIWSSQPGGATSTAELFTMPAAGGPAVQLTFNSVRDRGAAFSRDGLSRIFWVQDDPANAEEIHVMNADGSGGVLFASSPVADLAPAPEPAAVCNKKRATIIGTDASETLVGGPGPDVIAGFGGKDKIKGKGGKDTICGDAGKDNLNGGKGKDFLSGGKGKDKVVGGKGKDRCVGGKGNDSGKGCEKEKSL